jgi:hypothetical protein
LFLCAIGGPHPQPEPNKHPLTEFVRDSHLQKHMSTIPTHATKFPVQDSTSIHPKHAPLAHAVREYPPVSRFEERPEPKDPSAASSSRLLGALYALNDKLEAGVQVIRDKADEFAEKHLRSSPTPDNQPKLEDSRGNIVTLMDQYNQKNNHMVQAKSGIPVHDHYPKGPRA